MGSKYTQSVGFSGNVIRYAQTNRKSPLSEIEGSVPEGLVNCLKMCESNVVSSDFFLATLDWLKRELIDVCDKTEAEAASKIVAHALRAQAFKGADEGDLELMQIAVMDAIVDLNEAAEFDSCEMILESIEDPSPGGLSEGHEQEAAATKVVDAIAAAYWNPVIQLVDVLTEVVGLKRRQEYQEALSAWNSDVSAAKARFHQAENDELQAEEELDHASHRQRGLEEELRRAKSDGELRRETEKLIAESKRAENDLIKAEFGQADLQQNRETCERRIAQLRKELAEQGMFAFDRKKTLKREIESAETELKRHAEAIAAQDAKIATLRKKAGRRQELEERLAEMPPSQIAGLEDNLRDAKRGVELANQHLKEMQGRKSEADYSLKSCRDKQPKSSDYSAEAVKRPLRWRTTAYVAKGGEAGYSGGHGSPSGKNSGTGYRKGTGSTWRDRRPTFTDSNPIHLNSSVSSGFSGSRYTASVGYGIKADDPDMTHRMDIDIEGPSSAFDAANEFLSAVEAAFRHRDYSGKFSFLKDFKCRSLPFTSIDTRLYAAKLTMDELGAAIGLIGAVNRECPELRLDGVMEMVKSYAGIRNTYHVTSAAGDPTFTAEQKVEGLR